MLKKSKLQHELLNGRQFSFPFKFLIEVQLDRLKHSEAYFSSMTYQFLTWDFKLCNRSTVHPKIGYTCAEVYHESWGNYSNFFLSKKVFRCHSCKPATDKQMPRERNPSQTILEFVRLFRSCISSSLDTRHGHVVSELLFSFSAKSIFSLA